MNSKERLQRRLDALREQHIAEAEALLAKLELATKLDELPDDAVLYVRKRFERDCYTYAVIRIPALDRWYVTGRMERNNFDDNDLVSFLLRGELVELWLATDWENLL
jgi:hypothetical protein